jgi:very-short-patch-repair endonuclease
MSLSVFLHSKGCKKCLKELKNKELYTKQFICKAVEKHGNKYDYSKTEYVDHKTKVIIGCPQHGDSLQTPNQHINTYGCRNCAIIINAQKHNFNTEQFINKSNEIHSNKYRYDKTVYVNTRSNVIITCLEHGHYTTKAGYHLSKNGCPKCSKSCKKTTDEYIELAKKIHKNRYDYSNTVYVNYDTDVTIICSEHYEFKQNMYNHINGAGCPSCYNKTEGKLYVILYPIFSNLIKQFRVNWCINKDSKTNKYLPFDFCIPEDKIIIELDGGQHFKQVMDWKSPEEQYRMDKFKEQKANENEYSTIRILQDDVFYDRYNWLEELTQAIDRVKANGVITNIYLCKNNEYQRYHQSDVLPQPIQALQEPLAIQLSQEPQPAQP